MLARLSGEVRGCIVVCGLGVSDACGLCLCVCVCGWFDCMCVICVHEMFCVFNLVYVLSSSLQD